MKVSLVFALTSMQDCGLQEHSDSSLVLPIFRILAARYRFCQQNGTADKDTGHSNGRQPCVIENVRRNLLDCVSNIDGIPQVECCSSC